MDRPPNPQRSQKLERKRVAYSQLDLSLQVVWQVCHRLKLRWAQPAFICVLHFPKINCLHVWAQRTIQKHGLWTKLYESSPIQLVQSPEINIPLSLAWRAYRHKMLSHLQAFSRRPLSTRRCYTLPTRGMSLSPTISQAYHERTERGKHTPQLLWTKRF